MKKIIYLFLLLPFFVDAQNQWNIVGESVRTIPDVVSDSIFVLSAPSRAALRQGQANWTPSTSGAASYLVYTALLTQSGTDAPVATVLENTLGGTVVWSYSDVGSYLGTLTGAFTGNVIAMPTMGVDYNSGFPSSYSVYIDSVDAIAFNSFSDQFTTFSDGILSGLAYIEIRVYP